MNLIEALKTGRRVRHPSIGANYFEANNRDIAFKVFLIISDDWEVEPEQKKKVKMWLYWYQHTEGSIPYCTNSFFRGDEHFKDHNHPHAYTFGKIESSMIEILEDI